MKITRLVAVAAVVTLFGCASAPAGQTVAEQAATPKPLTGEVSPLDSFEDDPVWVAVAGSWKDGDNSTDGKIIEGHATDGKMSFQADFKMAHADKYATWFTEDLLVKDWTGVKSLVADIENPLGKPVKVTAFVCSGEKWDWHETVEVALAPGVNKNVVFDLTSVKSNLNSWAYSGGVAHAGTIQRVGFRLTAGVVKDEAGSLYIDNLRLVR